MSDEQFRLRSFGFGVRLGLTGFLFVLMGGLAASVAYIYNHYHNRDEQPKLTLTDIQGAYHGVSSTAPIVSALERGHPENLPAKDKDALLDWLLGKKDDKGARPKGGNPKLFETYDDIDAGELNPADILARACVSCHSRASTATGPDADKAKALPLNQWEDVKKQAVAKELSPTPTKVLIISTHAHALSLGSLGIVVVAMLALSRLPRALVGLLATLMGVGLLADIGGWWLSRDYLWGVYVLLAGGAAFNGATGLSLLLLLGDLWLPRRAG